jgi:hypothetical protein
MDTEDVIFNQSEQSSTVGRQIAFGLIAVAWAISYNDKNFYFDFYPCISILILVIYFSIDLIQYFFTTVKYRRIHIDYKIAKVLEKDRPTNNLDQHYNIEKAKIIEFSYRMFKIKFYLLPFSVIALLIYLVKILLK